MRDEILRVELLNKTIGNDRILNNVSFSLFKGETLALLGANGAGKTLLISALGGLTQIDSGNIYYRERKVTLRSPFDAKVLGIYVSNNKERILDNLTVADNITLGHEHSFFLSKRAYNKEAAAFLRDIGLTDVSPSKLAGELSLEQKALVQLASVYASHPSVLIIDEPSFFNSDMDLTNLKRAIHHLNKREIAVIYITHNIDDALDIASRVFVLRNGVAAGTFESAYCSKELLVSVMLGSEENEWNHKTRDSTDVVLSIDNLSGRILKNISFEVSRGEILGIAGITGSGKTELLEILFGLRPYTSGSITLNGKKLMVFSPADAISHGIAYAPEDITATGTIPTMTVRDNVTLSALKRVSSHGWICSKSENFFAESMLCNVSEDHIGIKKHLSELSGGALQKVLLARCLALKPEILLLDEPTKSIDLKSRKALLKGMASAAENGLTIIIASSDFAELTHICDRLIVIKNGIARGGISTSDYSANSIFSMIQNDKEQVEDQI